MRIPIHFHAIMYPVILEQFKILFDFDSMFNYEWKSKYPRIQYVYVFKALYAMTFQQENLPK